MCSREAAEESTEQERHGANAPIDTIGGVICSGLKGPVTPRDRCGNRYLVNFVDHRSNYCRVFLARTKDAAAEKFKLCLNFFEKQFSYRIHVLRTDGGGEYRVLDPFCGDAGVRRQISEASNQASNGKAERMYRTILNMARCMLFESGLPLKFGGALFNTLPTCSTGAQPVQTSSGSPHLRFSQVTRRVLEKLWHSDRRVLCAGTL